MPPTAHIPTIPPQDWNRTLRMLARKLNLAYQVSDRGNSFRHAWQTEAIYDRDKKQWLANLQPGYVNCAEVETPAIPAREAPAETRRRLGIASPRSREPVVPHLSEFPYFPIDNGLFREIGGSGLTGSSPEVIPPYFAELGVSEGPSIEVDEETSQVSIVNNVQRIPPEQRRRLKAVDIVLNFSRPALAPVAETQPDGTSRIVVTVKTGLVGAFISVVKKYEQVPEFPTLTEQLLSGVADSNEVQVHLATLYFLSPPGISSTAELDGSWNPIPAHKEFYSLVFATRILIDDFPDLNLTSPLPLAGGAGQGAVQNILDDINERDREAGQLLTRSGVKLSCWSV